MTDPSLSTGTVARTLRHAIKVGDEYVTVEETVTLSLPATDEQISRAVQTGQRIYTAQRAALDAQIADLRAQALTAVESDIPASDKQRAYLDYWRAQLNWTTERLAAFAAERGLDLAQLSKREASRLIDDLKALTNGHLPSEPATPPASASVPLSGPSTGARATARQLRALERAADDGRLDLEQALRIRFRGRALTALSIDEAGQLLTEATPVASRSTAGRPAAAPSRQAAPHGAGAPSTRAPVPGASASDAQLGKIAGIMHELRQAGVEEAAIDRIGGQLGVDRVSQYRSKQQLQALALGKANAGQLIDALHRLLPVAA